MKKSPLPMKVYTVNHLGQAIEIRRGESGYYLAPENHPENPAWVTSAHINAMVAGSMFGWSCPAANLIK